MNSIWYLLLFLFIIGMANHLYQLRHNKKSTFAKEALFLFYLISSLQLMIFLLFAVLH
ncbi:hypothetical protein JNUCC42_21815 [Brevibacterium sp. JNUCC-42]|nr:hypothetical protein [Brevibacillus laterosporus]QOS99001.1 hypothetical protein JNUCC42_21815 [Brevibacterium sp. JNUCC-42]RAP27916.1 hypothetical protein C2W64_00735 [Brevibacillus laterosporus]